MSRLSLGALVPLSLGTLLAFPLGASAQGTPVPLYGSNCPTHTQKQGGACVPNPGYVVWWNNGESCPAGVIRSKGYCLDRQ